MLVEAAEFASVPQCKAYLNRFARKKHIRTIAITPVSKPAGTRYLVTILYE